MACFRNLFNVCVPFLQAFGCAGNYRISKHFYTLSFNSNRHVLRRKAIQLLNDAEVTADHLTPPSQDSNTADHLTPPSQNSNIADHLTLSSQDSNLLVNEGKNMLLKDNFSTIENNEKMFKHLLINMKRRKFRERKQKIILEDLELIVNALRAGVRIEKLFYNKDSVLEHLQEYEHFKELNAYKITQRSMKDLSSNLFSPDVIAVCRKPSSEEIHIKSVNSNTIPVTVLCSDVRTPENLASILTVAAASGCKRVLLLKGCVDVWDRKVLNSANSAHFFLPIINNISWNDIKQYFSDDAMLYVADSSSDIDIADTQILIESNEFVSYPLITGESLPKEINNSSISSVSKTEEAPLKVVEDLPCMLYSEVTFPKKELVIYVGGETVGVNNNIQKLTHLPTQKIKLPLENDIESLNVSVALSVILFEIKRQFSF